MFPTLPLLDVKVQNTPFTAVYGEIGSLRGFPHSNRNTSPWERLSVIYDRHEDSLTNFAQVTTVYQWTCSDNHWAIGNTILVSLRHLRSI